MAEATHTGSGKWPRRRSRGGRPRPTYAALDLGTNNCRLLVARPSVEGFRVIDAFSRIVRLGEGMGRTGRLSDAAIERTIAALEVCANKMRRRGVTRARNVATAACRQAENCAEFLDRVWDATGLELEIISSGEEARLAVAGCRPLIVGDAEHALVFDIGGGSTEVTWLSYGSADYDVGAWTSLPHGVVTLAETYGGADTPRDTYDAMIATIEVQLQTFEAEHRLSRYLNKGTIQMLGTSGTVTTLAGVHLDLPRYDRAQVDGTWLTFEQAQTVSERLRAMPLDERARHPCIGQQRADLVVAGCAILEAICRTWPIGRLRVGDRGVREGLLLSLMQADGVREAGRG